VLAFVWSDGRAALQTGTSGAGTSVEARAHAALQAGNYASSIRLFQLALRHLAADTPTVSRGRLLEGLGESLRFDQRWRDSAAAFSGALTACESTRPVMPTWCARIRQRLAWVHLRLEKGDEAKSNLQHALALLATTDGPMAARAEVFETLGDAAYFDQDYRRAEEHYTRAVEEAGAQPDEAPLVLGSALRSRASARSRLGRPDEALADAARALSIATAELPAGHPELESYLNEAANAAWYQGDYTTARRRWEQALSVVERHFGRDHSRAATMLNNLSMLASLLGDHGSAIRLQDRVVTIVRREYGDAHQFLGQAYTQLGSIQLEAGDLPAARASFLRALAILERGATVDWQVGFVHIYLARLALATRRLTETRTHAAAAEAALGSTASSDPGRLLLQSVKGELAWLDGDLDAAERELLGAADVYEESYNGHPEVAHARQQLADIALARGETADAARLATEAEGRARSHLRLAMRDLSERLALSYDATRPPALDVLVSAAITSGEPEFAFSTLTELARSRGQVFDELVERRRPRGDVSPAEARLRDAYQAARSRWANIAMRGPSGAQDARYESALAAARDAVDASERALSEESAEFRRTRDRKEATVDDIRAALPADATLVSFVRYGRRVPLPPRPPGAPPTAPPVPVPSYVAIVTSRTNPPVLVDLGAAATIDRLVASWRDEAAHGVTKAGRTPRQAERAYRQAGTALRARIWDPLAAHVTGATRILVVPDGALQAVGFAALPVGTDRYLADTELAFHYLTTERDVLRPAATEHASQSMLVVGGVDFGGTAGAPSNAEPAGTRAARAPDLLRLPLNADGCVGLDEIEFPALPATAQEAREVEQMWRATGGTGLRLSGGQARERRIRDLAPQQRMLHFATHGFFLDSTCPQAAAGTRSVRKRVRPGEPALAPRPAAPSAPPPSTPGRRPVNPLALSGLAFANANRHAATTRGEDDGVLTAEEVAALDLQGVEWVVLSACDTGLGPIRAREGVLGLRRAFEVAGARTVIMSLWSVEDRTTRLWMRELYRSRLQGGHDTIDSMRDANRAMLEARRAAGATTHPYYWAGFVATGDWR
jgi:CHAT domain-containing protein